VIYVRELHANLPTCEVVDARDGCELGHGQTTGATVRRLQAVRAFDGMVDRLGRDVRVGRSRPVAKQPG
jgi:hypothetical protein